MSYGYDWERGDPRRTRIIDDPEPPYTNPNGIPDCDITKHEARLWLLSKAERVGGLDVEFNTTTKRWQRAADGKKLFEKNCEGCGILFTPARSDAKFHSTECRVKAYRKASDTLTGRLVPE